MCWMNTRHFKSYINLEMLNMNRIINFYRKNFWTAEKYAKHLGVVIGENCSISSINFGSEPYLIRIGNHVQITHDVRFATHGASWVLRTKYPNFDCFGKIIIGDNVYIGNCSIILPGVTIGNNVIVGAGSVVTRSIADGQIVGGNPAKVIGNMDDFENKMIRFNLDSKKMSGAEKKVFLLNASEDKFLKK